MHFPPGATYRLQFNRHFTFRDAAEIAGYLSEIGVTHLYASPIFTARPGSMHGYDIIDFSAINPELGGEEGLRRLVRALKKENIGILLDIVPNHMCVAHEGNLWWRDVLENGRSSPHAGFFAIEWETPQRELRQQALIPTLGSSLDDVLENKELGLSFDGESFWAQYYSSRFPLAPDTWPPIFDLALAKDPPPRDARLLRSLNAALASLPGHRNQHPARAGKRRREAARIKRRLSEGVRRSRSLLRVIEAALKEINSADRNSPPSRILGNMMSSQPYRLAFWREGHQKINYRRFFDISELAGLRVERRDVFKAVHALVFRLMGKGWVEGLRVDHVDGLYDPEKYLRALRREAHQGAGQAKPYILVEKILARDEALPPRWPVQGTTGYEFLNLLNGIFVAMENGGAFQKLYRRFTGERRTFGRVAYEGKKYVLKTSFGSDLNRLARLLQCLLEAHSKSDNVGIAQLEKALSELLAGFSVYRTYGRDGRLSEEDIRRIREAAASAQARRPRLRKLVGHIGRLLIDGGSAQGPYGALQREFLMRFQQLSGPVMAKGYEDTALYRYFPLASLNEVGGDPAVFGESLGRFHRGNSERLRRFPRGLSATNTHDTKRSEDVRARLNVLSEIPREWEAAVRRWRILNRRWKRRLDGMEAPDANDEYFLYQSLVGAWPCGSLTHKAHCEFTDRTQEHMQKALREAKRRSTWLNPDERYEEAVQRFVSHILKREAGNRFLKELQEFLARIVRPGLYNSLAQALLKIASPGIPDFYQGCESLSFTLVDPDNRRPVDYAALRRDLASIRREADLPALVQRLIRAPEDGRAKLFVISRALEARRRLAELFARGNYLPIEAAGLRKEHAAAFIRAHGKQAVLAAAGRLFTALGAADRPPLGRDVWEDGTLRLGRKFTASAWRDCFTGREWAAGRSGELSLAEVFSQMPVALLERIP